MVAPQGAANLIRTPRLVREVDALRAELAFTRERGLRVGVVPTMGALHAGHLALVHEARRHAQRVVVTVFVNPTQFGPGEDFTRYPRDLEGDLKKCASAGADLVFCPEDPSALYPAGDETRVRVPDTAKHLEGAFRLFQSRLLHGPIAALQEASRTGHSGTLREAIMKLFGLKG